MSRPLYTEEEKERIQPRDSNEENYRSVFRRDYARLLHSPSFRRLDGKTQLFPDHESDFFRNRLTHSLEVAQVAKSIAIRFNATGDLDDDINTDLVEFAALAHDIGHPPFGHNGEEALDECMLDAGGFEGNAQTLRIIARLEKKKYRTPPGKLGIDDNGNDQRLGLNLTYRSLASVLKYDRQIPRHRRERTGTEKGFYCTSQNLVDKIKSRVTGDRQLSDFKTVECSIMDIADDIAYSTYDLEDAFQAGFLQPMDLLGIDPDTAEEVAEEVEGTMEEEEQNIREAGFPDEADKYVECIGDNGYDSDRIREIMFDIFRDHVISEVESSSEPSSVSSQTPGPDDSTSENAEEPEDLTPKEMIELLGSPDYQVSKGSLFYREAKDVAKQSFRREKFTSDLIGQFIQSTHLLVNEDIPALSRAYVDPTYRERIETLKHFTFISQIQSARLQVVEYRGKDIVKQIFDALNKPGGERLLPDDYRLIHDRAKDELKKRTICDFVAGMTDRYALDYYARITSGDEQTIFKPY
ncbi:hypothetical protein BSZ35_00050 [Salinibacter sp. 10B]|uniref:dGTP triphosphohydrolase n=1 Tax=Salinibacter sp. 10B TaxID=1923971 RepID=UPI000D2E0A69|nr:dNTP triphosphohydrolase [Salinibacter sp. 10B]PQJ36781.1 hypothetical protein BSZ35_00050 [Salinibacter sp. 10B]